MSQPLRRSTRRAAVAMLAATLLLAAAVVTPVSAKMFGEARLDAQISFESPPGATLLVGATIRVLGSDGRLEAGADGPVVLEVEGRDGDRTTALGVADGAPGHYTFLVRVPEGGARDAGIRIVGEPNVTIHWLSSPVTPFPIGPGTAQLAPSGSVAGAGGTTSAPAPVAAPPAAVAAAPAPAPVAQPVSGVPPAAAALVVGLAAVVLALAAVLLLRRSRGAPAGRAADGAPGA